MIQITASADVQTMYLIMGGLLAFSATYVGWMWWQVSGVRGAMLMMLFASLAIVCLSLALLHSNDPRIPTIVILAVSRAGWIPATIAALVLCDLYASDHNDHKSLTTRTYTWYKRNIGNGENRSSNEVRT